jgi:uncharacterized membrane protein YsdA (DUF1294 family)/cold shock CspA family protein
MRLAGRISGWNDDKGYGFVVPHDGGDRAFVHIKAFQAGSRRPVDGDMISYAVTRDGRGRRNATEVRFAGQRIERRKPAAPSKRGARTSRIPRMLLGSACLLAVVPGTVFGILPLVVAIACMLLSLLSYLMYWMDKEAAQRGAQRIAEGTLHLVDLLGGWPGALIAQQQFRHKTVKASFQFAFWCSVLANIAIVAWLVRSGIARALTDALLGI